MNPTLECQNPYHPPGHPRNTMQCVQEAPEFFVFMCKTCLDVRKLRSIQVKTRAWVKQEARRSLAARGQLLKALPPRQKKFIMDESLRKERNR